MSLRNNPDRKAPGSPHRPFFPMVKPMLHTPIPDRIASAEDEKRLPPMAGILIAMAGSVMLWGGIFAVCSLGF